MQRSHGSRTPRRLLLSILGCLTLFGLLLSNFALSKDVQAATKSGFSTLPGSVAPWTKFAHAIGHHNAQDSLNIGVMLKTTHAAEQQSLLKALYQANSPQYHQWLQTGNFAARFAPDAADVAATQAFLVHAGLTLAPSSDKTMLLATGTTHQIEAAFHTTINDYVLSNGQQQYGNSSDVQIPTSVSHAVLGVFGLNSLSSMTSGVAKPNTNSPGYSYGGGPNGSGLTPSQIAGIYNANPVYKQLGDKGRGTTLAVFELSGYKRSDIRVYEKQYHLPNVYLIDKPVLGGPTDHTGATEVELDIELQIAMAPGMRRLEVYNAPNTELGALSEYLKIAKDNTADIMSSSWNVVCEYGLNSQVTLAENQIFLQMGLQGQSPFIDTNDAGAFGCSRVGLILPFPQSLQIGDPNNQPYVTAVGGTSFRTQNGGPVNFNPGTNPNPTYPGTKKEAVWNGGCVNNNNCPRGAAGGGVSRIWAEPDYAFDPKTGNPLPGIIETKYSQIGAYCNQQPGDLCRENPDVSLDADPNTGYSVYCTDPDDPFCVTGDLGKPGWILIGGTSCAAPLWSGIAALADTHAGKRLGLFNYLVYPFDSTAGYAHQFHDITIGDNGYYPAGKTYDLSTGIGTPDIYNLIKAIS